MEPQRIGASAIVVGLATIISAAGIEASTAASQCGKAAWYEAGGLTASGERNAAGALTGAHPTLPFGTRVSVENLGNGKSAVVRINDRAPFVNGRIIDVSRAAAEQLGLIQAGVARVKVTVIGAADLLKGSCAEGAEAAAVPVDSAGPLLQYPPQVSAETMAARFTLAFQPESGIDFEMTKALEAVLTEGQGGRGGQR